MHLMNSPLRTDVTSFFFCRHDDQDSLRARTIIGSIARQMVADMPPKAFCNFKLRNGDIEDISKFLGSILTESRRYFIVLDGLEECDERQVQEVALALQDLLDSYKLNLKIYCSARPYVTKWLTSGLRPDLSIILETPENQTKIAHGIRSVIETTLIEHLEGETPDLQLGKPSLILTVQDTLQKQSSRNVSQASQPTSGFFAYRKRFLWVKFQLHDLCDQKSDDQILALLEDLPHDLPQTFERILRRCIRKHEIDICRQMFRWAAVSRRPLTLAELREAITIEPLQEDWRPERLINDMKKAVACCGNVLFIDEEDQVVQFTHSSVKQYLISNDVNDGLQHYRMSRSATSTSRCTGKRTAQVFVFRPSPNCVYELSIHITVRCSHEWKIKRNADSTRAVASRPI